MKVLVLALLLALVAADFAPLLHSDSPVVVPGSYIVVLKDGMELADHDAHILALQDQITANNEVESEISFRYNIGSFVGFAARLNKKLLTEQLAHPNVQYIEADQVVSINYIQERAPAATVTQSGATWGLDRIDQRNLPLDGRYVYNSLAGNGVDVFVIDTGILATHNDFGGRATNVFNAVTGEPNTDLHGHGTHCAGTVGGTTYGVAKQVQLKGVKVLNSGGNGTSANTIAGVNYITNNKSPTRKSVCSMSLGGPASSALDTAVTNSITSGVTYVVAAGNEAQNACNVSPARTATAITVGGTTSTDARGSYSNFGTCLTVFGPGSSITSDWIGSNSATATISGTSMATPHVAGVIALQLAQGSLTPAQAKTWITSNATPNKVTSPGTGSPNLLLYSNPM